MNEILINYESLAICRKSGGIALKLINVHEPLRRLAKTTLKHLFKNLLSQTPCVVMGDTGCLFVLGIPISKRTKDCFLHLL